MRNTKNGVVRHMSAIISSSDKAYANDCVCAIATCVDFTLGLFRWLIFMCSMLFVYQSMGGIVLSVHFNVPGLGEVFWSKNVRRMSLCSISLGHLVGLQEWSRLEFRNMMMKRLCPEQKEWWEWMISDVILWALLDAGVCVESGSGWF